MIDVRRQNANYCRDHFLRMCRDQVAKAIHDFDMLRPGERVLVAVSGGKDSLACWHILRELGYDADGFVIGLGIGEYSDESTQFARSFAEERGWKLHETSLRTTTGSTCRPRRRPPIACRVARAGCRSATCSTRRRASTATTSSPRATTSTTRPPFCSATCCAGRPTTSAGNYRCCRNGTAFRAR